MREFKFVVTILSGNNINKRPNMSIQHWKNHLNGQLMELIRCVFCSKRGNGIEDGHCLEVLMHTNWFSRSLKHMIRYYKMLPIVPPIKLRNTAGTNLLQMNDDCLMEIFSVKSLNPMDLCSLSETCRRFQRITLRIAPKTIEIRHIPSSGFFWFYAAEFEVKFGNSCKTTRKDVVRIVKNFGPSLLSVKIEGHDHSEDNFLLQLIAKHCNELNLEDLWMVQIQIQDVQAVKLKPIFNKLMKLHLDHVKIMGDDATLFANLNSLIELNVEMVENCGTVLENDFPKLMIFQYTKSKIAMADLISYSGEQTLDDLLAFISRHSSLKILELILFECNNHYRTTILQSISSSCKELLSLGLCLGAWTEASVLQPLQKIKSLQGLHLWWFSVDNFEFLSALTELRELGLLQCQLPEDSEHFTCLNQLKILFLHKNNSVDAVGLIRRLTNLDEFQYNYPLDEATVNEIVSVVRERQTVVTLKCNSDFNMQNYDKGAQNVRLLSHESNPILISMVKICYTVLILD